MRQNAKFLSNVFLLYIVFIMLISTLLCCFRKRHTSNAFCIFRFRYLLTRTSDSYWYSSFFSPRISYSYRDSSFDFV